MSRKKLISSEDAMKMLYQPGNIERFSLISSDLKNAIHLGTELDDVKRIIPERYIESIEQIRHINYKLVSNDLPRGKYVTYELLADSE